MPTTRLLCSLPRCTWGVAEYGQDVDGKPVVEVEEGGRYMTPSHLQIIEQTQDDLKLHVEAHKIIIPTATPTAAAPSQAKPAKLEPPRMDLDMTEPEWGLFIAEWKRYCRSCKLTDKQEKVDQLSGCQSANLKRAAAGDGLESMEDDGLFLPRLKLLVVKKHNPLVAQIKFLSMGQDAVEPVHS